MIDALPTIRLRGEQENEQIHREIDLVIRMHVGHLSRMRHLKNAYTSFAKLD